MNGTWEGTILLADVRTDAAKLYAAAGALDCHLSILSELTSRHHCTIERRDDAFVLRDHSTNGTFITEEGRRETHLQNREAALGAHGWLTLGQPRAFTDQVVEYFCE